jgi:rod shape determining protein RodA
MLSVFGLMNIYSTQSDTQEIFDFTKKHGMQLMWMLISFIFATAVLVISSRFYLVFAYHIYIFAIILLILTLLIGIEVKSSKSWLGIGNFRFQPAEFAKLATSLALARLFGQSEFKFKTFKNRLKAIMTISLPTALVLLQRDWGSALVFGSFMFVLYRQGMSGSVLAYIAFTIVLFISTLMAPPDMIYAAITLITIIIAFIDYKDRSVLTKAVLPGLALLGIGIAYNNLSDSNIEYEKIIVATVLMVFVISVIYLLFKRKKIKWAPILFFISSITISYSADYTYNNVLKTHHRDRIEDMLGIKVDIKNAGYNVYQSKIAIGSGGFAGKGFLEGTQTKLNFVPEQSTDFIFCTIGEEWGFIGSAAVIFIYCFLLIRLILIAERQKTVFARTYGYCIVSIIFFHFTINIAMTVGLAPVIGIPLPYMSAGGSSLLSFTLLLFIFLKLDSTNHTGKPWLQY